MRQFLIYTRVLFLVLLVLLSLVGAAFLAARHFSFILVTHSSMDPALPNRTLVVVRKAPSHLEDGDIVVFHQNIDGQPQLLIKRVYLTPLDSFSVRAQSLVAGSHPPLHLSFKAAQALSETGAPPRYFVLGDNRAVSVDSRFFGPVSASQIVGKVVYPWKA